MNFSRLLAAGRSIINSGGSVTYRENKSVYLPKFESPRNPFAKSVPAPAPAPGSVGVSGPVAPKGSAPAAAPARPARVSRTANWPASLNPMAMLRGVHSPANRPVKAEQTELSLDSVRVVGSDLTNEDVEIVPLKSRPARPKKAVQPSADWSEVETGVLGANLV
jgi:hypothetical protein